MKRTHYVAIVPAERRSAGTIAYLRIGSNRIKDPYI